MIESWTLWRLVRPILPALRRLFRVRVLASVVVRRATTSTLYILPTGECVSRFVEERIAPHRGPER